MIKIILKNSNNVYRQNSLKTLKRGQNYIKIVME